MSDDFNLEPSGVLPPPRGGARPGAGRPRGRKNKRVSVLWEQARIASGGILHQHIEEAQKLSQYMQAGDFKRARIAFDCGEQILERTWPAQRGAPIAVNIAQLGGAALVEAVQAGELTASDAAALLRARSQTIDVSPVLPVEGAREKLVENLMKVMATRTPDASANGASGHGDHSDAPPSDEVDITPADIEAAVAEAVRKAVEGRFNGQG